MKTKRTICWIVDSGDEYWEPEVNPGWKRTEVKRAYHGDELFLAGNFDWYRAVDERVLAEPKFEEQWICECHPDKSWPHDDCPGPGMLKEFLGSKKKITESDIVKKIQARREEEVYEPFEEWFNRTYGKPVGKPVEKKINFREFL